MSQTHRCRGKSCEDKIQWFYSIRPKVRSPSFTCSTTIIKFISVAFSSYLFTLTSLAIMSSDTGHRYGFYYCRYGIEGPVYLTAKGEKGVGDWYVDEEKQKIVKMDGSLSYSVLQTVRIHMEVVEPQPNRPKLELTLL